MLPEGGWGLPFSCFAPESQPLLLWCESSVRAFTVATEVLPTTMPATPAAASAMVDHRRLGFVALAAAAAVSSARVCGGSGSVVFVFSVAPSSWASSCPSAGRDSSDSRESKFAESGRCSLLLKFFSKGMSFV